MALNAGTAVAYLDLDTTGFTRGLKTANAQAAAETEKLSDKLNSVGESMSKIGGFASKWITTPIVGAVTASVKQFANLEQSIGGVETLFKDSADVVIKNAERAYKTAGVDANAYMEQVTSFSASLLQSLGGDTARAAETADQAIIDMADNANKMGTAMESIQNAYQGFAKQNYTMLDNLKLGYGGTKAEMERLLEDASKLAGVEFSIDSYADIIDAIHVIQEDLDITGTTAKEASETITGSFNAAKSSILNFLQQLGNPGADMDKFTEEMMESIQVFLKNVKRTLGTIWDNLPLSDFQKKMLAAATAVGPLLLAVGKLLSLFKTVKGVVGPIIEVLSGAGGLSGAISTLLGPIGLVVAAIAALALAWKTDFAGIREFTSEFFSKISELISIFVSWFQEHFGDKITGIIDTVKEVFAALEPVVSSIFDFILDALDVFIALFSGDFEGLKDAVDKVIEDTKDLLKNFGNALLDIGKMLVQKLWDGMKEKATAVSDWIQEKIGGIKEFFGFENNYVGSKVQDTARNTLSTNLGGVKAKPFYTSHGGTNPKNPTTGGNTYIFNSPKAQTPKEQRQSYDKVAQRAALGF